MSNRKRFSLNRICSSENYTESKKIHNNFIRLNHQNNEVELIHIEATFKKLPYVRCFDKLIQISEEEAKMLTTCTIIWK